MSFRNALSASEALTAETTAAMASVQMAVNLAPYTDPMDILAHASSLVVLKQVAATLPMQERRISPNITAERGIQLIGIARDQSSILLGAAEQVIPGGSLPNAQMPEHVASVLRASGELGSQFGRVSKLPRRHGEKNDWNVADAIGKRPEHYLEYDGGQVVYTDVGQELLHRDRPADAAGCPFMVYTSDKPGLPTANLFRLFWSGFTEQHIEKRMKPVPSGLFRRVLAAL